MIGLCEAGVRRLCTEIRELVSWSLTSLFSTNMATSETTEIRQVDTLYPTWTHESVGLRRGAAARQIVRVTLRDVNQFVLFNVDRVIAAETVSARLPVGVVATNTDPYFHIADDTERRRTADCKLVITATHVVVDRSIQLQLQRSDIYVRPKANIGLQLT